MRFGCPGQDHIDKGLIPAPSRADVEELATRQTYHPAGNGNCTACTRRSFSSLPTLSRCGRRILFAMKLVIYCADIGSIPNRRFGWARSAANEGGIERHRSGTEIIELLDGVAEDLAAGRGVALGFECPLFVPVPEQPLRLGMARAGERNRPWSAGAGAGAMATGIVEVAWILAELRRRCPKATPYLDWTEFATGRGLFVWEAFVTAGAKAATHVDDATVAVAAFRNCLPDPTAMNAVTAERPLSLIGTALLWSGWSTDAAVLHAPCLVIKAALPAPAGLTGTGE
jgi:hypothetical protein